MDTEITQPGITQPEIERAFADYQAAVTGIVTSGDWASFADLFSEDATYEEHAFGTFSGREAIRSWVVTTMTSFPGNDVIVLTTHDLIASRPVKVPKACSS